MFVGKDIYLKRYERSTFFRFFMLLFGSYLLMYVVVASLYYHQEYTRLSKELSLQGQLEYIECKSLDLPSCSQGQLGNPNMQKTYKNILFVFGLLLILIIPISIFLSFFSLKPVGKASTMIDNFIANIVHDINTPINTIMLNTKSLMKSSAIVNPKLTRTLASADQLSDMQHDLLALADEKVNVEIHAVELKEFIEEIIEEFTLKHNAQQFILRLNALTLYLNRIDLRRILQNLISNAIKYNCNNHPITIYTQEHFLIIEDKGKGIENPEKVFERNYREDYSIQGNGLGLASVLAMLDRNNMGIKVLSTLGTGTTIYLNFQKILERQHK